MGRLGGRGERRGGPDEAGRQAGCWGERGRRACLQVQESRVRRAARRGWGDGAGESRRGPTRFPRRAGNHHHRVPRRRRVRVPPARRARARRTLSRAASLGGARQAQAARLTRAEPRNRPRRGARGGQSQTRRRSRGVGGGALPRAILGECRRRGRALAQTAHAGRADRAVTREFALRRVPGSRPRHGAARAPGGESARRARASRRARGGVGGGGGSGLPPRRESRPVRDGGVARRAGARGGASRAGAFERRGSVPRRVRGRGGAPGVGARARSLASRAQRGGAEQSALFDGSGGGAPRRSRRARGG